MRKRRPSCLLASLLERLFACFGKGIVLVGLLGNAVIKKNRRVCDVPFVGEFFKAFDDRCHGFLLVVEREILGDRGGAFGGCALLSWRHSEV